jgi:hypothetical protein
MIRCEFCGDTIDSAVATSGECCRVNTKSDPVVLIVDRVAVYSVKDWFAACPPKGGEKQWKDGYCAKESAKAWLRHGAVTLPQEVATLLASHRDLIDFRLGTVTPEVCTRLDDYRQGRNADVVATGTAMGKRTLIAIEAKAAEDFGEPIEARLRSALSGTNVHDRINSLASAVFGRGVLTVDPVLGELRYQLLHAIAGTVIEATDRRAEQAVFIVHYFPNPRRVMDETFKDFRTFVRMLKSDAEVNPDALLRVNIPGSSTISKDLPLYVGWATAPVAS